jgi:hypothetical protein
MKRGDAPLRDMNKLLHFPDPAVHGRGGPEVIGVDPLPAATAAPRPPAPIRARRYGPFLPSSRARNGRQPSVLLERQYWPADAFYLQGSPFGRPRRQRWTNQEKFDAPSSRQGACGQRLRSLSLR